MHDFCVKLFLLYQHFEYTIPFPVLIYCLQANFLTAAAIYWHKPKLCGLDLNIVSHKSNSSITMENSQFESIFE